MPADTHNDNDHDVDMPDAFEARVRAALHELGDGVSGEPRRARAIGLGAATPDHPRWSSARWAMVAAIVVLVVAGGALVLSLRSDDEVHTADSDTTLPSDTTPQSTPTDPGSTLAPTTTLVPRWTDQIAPDSTIDLPPAPIAPRSAPMTVWTGSEMIVWGGFDGDFNVYADGAAFNPANGTWRVLSPSPLSPRQGAVAVWTGAEMIVWGGTNGSEPYSDGAAYDPATDSWRPLPTSPVAGQLTGAGAWTGTELIVLAGSRDGDTYSTDSAAFDPATSTWRSFATIDGELGGANWVAWTGRSVLAVIGLPANAAGNYRSALFQLDPSTGAEWSLVVDNVNMSGLTGTPGAAVGAVAWHPEPGPVFDLLDVNGATLDTDIAGPVRENAEGGPSNAVWTGTEMIWIDSAGGGAFDPTNMTARAFTIPEGFTQMGQAPAMVWADGVVIAWGRTILDETISVVDEGFVYRPPSDAVHPTPGGPVTTTVPPAAGGHAIVAVHDDVAYYIACEDVPLTIDGTTYYPMLPEEREVIDQSQYPLPNDPAAPAGLVRVAPPGPGDDIGVVVIYDDGVARFESDSGQVMWLIDEERTYNWVC